MTSQSEQETVEVDQGKVTFGYTRKHNLGNYEMEEASVFATFTVPTSVVPGFIKSQGKQRMDELKAHVWDTLNLDMVYLEDGTPVLRPTVAVAAAPAIQVAPPVPMPVTVAQTPPPNPSSGMAQVGAYAAPPGPCGECGMNDWWDNRAEQDVKIGNNMKIGPDWKCKNQTCKHGVFRPNSFQYNKQAGAHAPQPVVAQVAQQFNPNTQPPPGPPVTQQPPPQVMGVAVQGYGPDEAPF